MYSVAKQAECGDFSVELPADKTAPSIARRALDERLPPVTEHERTTLDLLVTELVANAVLHSGNETDQKILLVVEVTKALIQVCVFDAGAGFQKHQPSPRGATGGYGLFLVDKMSSRWGVKRNPRNCVWIELERNAA